MTPAAATRVFYLLSVTRWLPVGFVVSLFVLLQVERGLTVAQALTATSIAGFACFLLELPTSGFADGFGRRPVYVAAASINVLLGVLYLVAQSFWAFALAAAVNGIFRALDSGPLEAWFVDAVHRDRPGADVTQELSKASTLFGLAIAVGALLSGGLIWWHPVTAYSAITGAVAVFALLNVVHLVAVLVLMKEPRDERAQPTTAWAEARRTPSTIAGGLRLVRHNRVLAAVLGAEVCWSVSMISFEFLFPLRLAEMLGSEADAGAMLGPAGAVGWGVFALGTTVAGWSSARIGVARTAILGRALNSIGAIIMGLTVGPAALLVAYFFTYTFHGTNGPAHAALLHREASSHNRATVLSMNSMLAFLAFAITAPLAGALADRSSLAVSIIVCGAVGLLGVIGYLPARKAELA